MLARASVLLWLSRSSDPRLSSLQRDCGDASLEKTKYVTALFKNGSSATQ